MRADGRAAATRHRAAEELFHAIKEAGGVFAFQILRTYSRDTIADGWRGIVLEMLTAWATRGQSAEDITDVVNEEFGSSETPSEFAHKLDLSGKPDSLLRHPPGGGGDDVSRHLDELCATWARYKSAATPPAERLEVWKDVAAAIRRLEGVERLETGRSAFAWLIGKPGDSQRARSSRALAFAFYETEDPTLFPSSLNGQVCVERQEIGPAFGLTDKRLRQLRLELEAARFPTPRNRAATA